MESTVQPFISVVIPCYDEAENVGPLYRRLSAALEPLGPWELLFCDDGSSDGTLEVLKELRGGDPRIRFVSFSRNFGHQEALRAGLERAAGVVVVTMDADLQHPPELIGELVAKYGEGYDVVYTLRDDGAAVGAFKRFSSRAFYRLANAFSDVRIEAGAADFRLLSRRAVDALLRFKEHGVFWRGAVPWIGFPQAAVRYEPGRRLHGKSKYSLHRMVRFAADGVTSFSVRPLRLTTAAGALCSLVAFVYMIYALAVRLLSDRAVTGWASLLISVLFIGGVQLISVGILGEYLGKVFLESKGRPHYIVQEESE